MTERPNIRFRFELGEIVVAPDYDRAPATSRHFVGLVRDGWLKEATFYRVVRAMPAGKGPPTIDVVQGGLGFDRSNEPPSVPHESTAVTGLSHQDGVISLARGAEPMAWGEFFICLGDNRILDAGTNPNLPEGGDGFAAWGQVIAGMDVVKVLHQMPSPGPVPGDDERLKGQFLDPYLPVTIELIEP